MIALALAFAQADRVLADGASDAPAAQSLFDAGRVLVEAERYEEACPKFEASNKLDPSAGTLLNLARCYEMLGKTASAWAAYNQAITLGRATGKPRQVAAAEELVRAIEPKLTKLVVRMADPPPNLRVTRDDVALDVAALGVPIAVDPGDHVIVAEAPGFEPARGHVRVDQEGSTVTFDVPMLEHAASVEAPAPVVPPNTRPVDAVAGSRTEIGPIFISGVVVGGAGVVSLAVGTAFGALTLADADTAANDPSLCPSYRCSEKGLAFVEDAHTKATVSTALLVSGGIAAATGVVLVLLDWPATAPVRPVALDVPSGVGLAFRGDL